MCSGTRPLPAVRGGGKPRQLCLGKGGLLWPVYGERRSVAAAAVALAVLAVSAVAVAIEE